MKKHLLTLIFIGLVLGGCVSPATQMINNKFLDAEVTQPEATGIWTTAAAGGLSTIKLNQDGTGVMCEDNGHSANVYQLRNSNNLIYVQNGMSLKKTVINKEFLNLRTTLSAFNIDMKYQADNELKLASPKCAQELK
ncbi:J517_1871 family lipoprotein [Acinetobacter terrae]|uniref:J517_1871 family lipoprotein n=1 Tax=Acinetobacter terrae TaxID=2731247 RepID=UPI0007D85399|nr:J517_1871 family lipoprotein [Acinetobacter terrae]OAL80357.1 hypothetical protein AY608_05635 [Acinetobacter terrae]